MRNGLWMAYAPFSIFSTVGAMPSMLSTLTLSSAKATPVDAYPIACGFSATLVIMTLVPGATSASIVMLSLPSIVMSTISTNAPRVPLPSSRVTTLTGPVVAGVSASGSGSLSAAGASVAGASVEGLSAAGALAGGLFAAGGVAAVPPHAATARVAAKISVMSSIAFFIFILLFALCC